MAAPPHPPPPPRAPRSGRAAPAGRLAAGALLGALAVAAATGEGRAQEPAPTGADTARREAPRAPAPPNDASAYLPLDHWAYPVLDRWIAAGRLSGLSPFLQPYRRMDVARALLVLEAAAERLGGAEAAWLRRLREELAPELAALGGRTDADQELRVGGAAGLAWRSQTHRDPLRAAAEGPFARDRLLEHVSVRAHGQAGHLAAGFRGVRDGLYRHDAQFPDGRVVPDLNFPLLSEFGYRTEEGWVELQTRYAALGFGRMARNWGLPGLHGHLRSDYAYSTEELTYRAGVDRLFLAGAFSILNDAAGDTARYLSVHRLEARPGDRLALAVTEAVLWGGPDARLDLGLLNPLSFWHALDGPVRNSMGQVDVWWRAVDGLALMGTLVVDGTNTPRTSNACCALGGSLGADLTRLAPGWLLRVRASAIQSLVYRTGIPWEEWSFRGLGLGWDKADLYLGTLEAEWLAADGLLLRPRLDLQRLGEGDFRQSHPPGEALPEWPRILVGTAETTWRASVAGRWRPAGAPLDVEWDLGVNRVLDAGHVEGASRTSGVGWVRVRMEAPELRLRLAG